MKGFEGLAVLDLSLLGTDADERVVLTKYGEPYAAIVSLDDLKRLQSLDQRRRNQETAARKGEPWEDWEDALLRDTETDAEEAALATQRTLHSVQERRRWILKIAEAEAGGG